jgi:streptogramin lyase
VAVGPNGDIYVSDGYGNARVHQFSPDGDLIRSWGEPGMGPGHFNLPHDVWVHSDGRVLVADRENERIQIFSPDGEFIEQWTDLQRPAGLCIGADGLIYVAEMAWRARDRTFTRGVVPEVVPGHVSVLDLSGRRLMRLGLPDGMGPASFWAPHGICVDSHGDIYVAEVIESHWRRTGSIPPGSHTLQKLARSR